MSKKHYTVGQLAEFLDIFRQLVIKHPEFELVELDESGTPFTTNQLEDLRRDLAETNLSEDGFERSFEDYLTTQVVGSKEYAVYIYMAMDQLVHKLLIDEEGQCKWENHRALGHYGYRVRKGEGDSFGWLTGIVFCDEFHHVYG